MSPTPDPRAPNERLAEIIAEALISSGLIQSPRHEELRRKLAAGEAKAEDWSLWIEESQGLARRKERGADE